MTGSTPDGRLEARALALFTQSLDMPATARAAFIDAGSEGDSLLRDAALRLLAAESAGAGFLDAHPLNVVINDRSGERIGRFRLVERISSGGMGTVYRARRDDGAYRQDVAVKLIRPELVSDEGLQRFLVERQILARLDHPGIARLIDGGTDTAGMPYVVMDLVDGEPIDAYCEKQRLGVAARLRLLQDVCAALHAAHQQGVVHRDIKPGNILVTPHGQTRLLDFGIAKVLNEDDATAAQLRTRTGFAAMTPQYASPEQVSGATIGIGTDIYSLGVLLYQLLTGARPYSVDSLSPGALEHAVCHTIPPNPSAAVARRRAPPPDGLPTSPALTRALRGDLDRVVMTALAKQPDERYATALAFSDDIERYLSGLPVHARGASRLYRLGKFAARHRAGVAATVVAFAALAAALVVVSLQAREAAFQRDLARQEAARAASARDFLVEIINRADPFANVESATLAGALRQSIPGISERFAGQPTLEAEMRYAIGYALQNLGEVAPARDLLDGALALRESEGNTMEIARVLDALGIVDWWDSAFADGEARFRRGIELLGGTETMPAVGQRVEMLTNLCGMLAEAGDYQRAHAECAAAVALGDRVPAIGQTLQATAWNNFATVLESLELNDEAEAAFERTLALRRSAVGELHADYAITLNNLAFLLVAQERMDEAVATFRQALEIERALLPEGHPEIAMSLMNFAWATTRTGEFEAAEAAAQEALAISRASYSDNHPRTGKAHETLASLYLRRDQPDLAREHALAARAIYSKAESVNPRWVEMVDSVLRSLDERPQGNL